MKTLALTAFLLTLTLPLHAAVQSKLVEYKQGDQVLEGYLAWDDAVTGTRPGVLVVHEWTGLGDYVKMRASKLAELGYIAFAADIYGKGIRPATPQEAGAQAGIYKKNPKLMRERVIAGLDVLRSEPLCDPKRVAAIGYCFGGTCVLELARSGAERGGRGKLPWWTGHGQPGRLPRTSAARCWCCTAATTRTSRPRKSRPSKTRCGPPASIGSWSSTAGRYMPSRIRALATTSLAALPTTPPPTADHGRP